MVESRSVAHIFDYSTPFFVNGGGTGARTPLSVRVAPAAIAQGSKIKYGCLAAHRRDPTGGDYKLHHQDITGTSKVSKRRRKMF